MEENEELKEAVEKLDSLSADERMQRIAELRVKGRRDEYARRQYAIKQGLEQGSKKREAEIVKNMLKENMPIDLIAKLTGLTKKEVEKMKCE